MEGLGERWRRGGGVRGEVEGLGGEDGGVRGEVEGLGERWMK